jgi:hypothetical protein
MQALIDAHPMIEVGLMMLASGLGIVLAWVAVIIYLKLKGEL